MWEIAVYVLFGLMLSGVGFVFFKLNFPRRSSQESDAVIAFWNRDLHTSESWNM